MKSIKNKPIFFLGFNILLICMPLLFASLFFIVPSLLGAYLMRINTTEYFK